LLGIDGSLSPRLQEKICLLAADVSFDKAREYLTSLLGVRLATETVRDHSERKAAVIARWQTRETDSADAFAKAEGQWEFTVDAGKVNTLENGWRDLKIAVAQKRPAAQSAKPEEWQSRKLPAATARVMWADIAAAKRFRRHWKTRLERLGLKTMADLHVLGDGASWIWKSAIRALTGCHQTLDIYHACEHIAGAGKKLFGEGTPAATAFFERGRDLLLDEGWTGICRLVGEEYQRQDTPFVRAILEPMTRYFVAHLRRLGYRDCLATGQAIGSGVVEGAAKTLGLRLKARGARWKHKNARAMAALVCARNGEEWSGYWRNAA
jgi:catechol 2,3-dioxygenase-like lactoylglutathione lyase family enzyme